MYENCISSLSTCASGKDSPAFHVLSSTEPVSRFFSLLRTNAGPLPGLTCRNSCTRHADPSISIVRPTLKSFVVPMRGATRRRRSLRPDSGGGPTKAASHDSSSIGNVQKR